MLKLQEHKEPQHNLPCESFLNPERLCLPLSQHTGKPSLVCVKPQDVVEQGQVIATEDGHISSRLHSPKKAKIVSIDDWFHPVLKRAKCIITEPFGDEEHKFTPKSKVDNLNKETLLKMIKDCGIVGMGGAAFPTHVKLSPPKKIETLIINGCECEPYLASDYRLMVENLDAIFKGIEIVCKIIEPKNVIFAVEENKPEAIKKLHLAVSLKKYNLPKLSLAILKTAYPQGGEKQLIYSLTKRKVPSGGLPLDVSCLVHNIGTFFAIYEAIYLDKPLIERVVTFAGDALVSPKNIRLKIGTTLRELFDKKILEFKTEPSKIICGGPMMGIALESLEYPILKANGGFLFLNKIKTCEENTCIRCARCVDACPLNLLPLEYAKRVKRDEYNKLGELNIKDCIECGCCSYTCPAKIPLVHYIKIGKKYASNN
ncbi:MAG: electron transport complex subunit RsxC [Candidatus Omnitrophica bacterium]|jgi:electron transport complex protein RnfC|nr:electron transport complex subunit RsxC [Candidatus Omnitrophota bacterium]